jgi:hypothetical protein
VQLILLRILMLAKLKMQHLHASAADTSNRFREDAEAVEMCGDEDTEDVEIDLINSHEIKALKLKLQIAKVELLICVSPQQKPSLCLLKKDHLQQWNVKLTSSNPLLKMSEREDE